MSELDPLPTPAVPEADRSIRTSIFHKHFSAAACVASRGGEIFHNQVYGTLQQPPPAHKTERETLFDLGELTQPLGSGLAAMWLSSRSQLDLGAPLSVTLPQFRSAPWPEVTIDMLLDHTSGLPFGIDIWREISDHDAGAPSAAAWLGTADAKRHAIERVSAMRLQHEPGKSFLESDIAFMLLGWIIEGAVGRSLDDWLMREIYRPLGLQDELLFVRASSGPAPRKPVRRTFAAGQECLQRGRMLDGEVSDLNTWAQGGVAGHAGLFGTGEGVWRLVHAMWASQAGEGDAFLAGGVRRFWRRSQRVKRSTKTLAWDTPTVSASSVGKRFARNAVGRDSRTGCSVWIDLAHQTIGVLLTNSDHPSAEGSQEALAELRPKVFEHLSKHAQSMPEPSRGPEGWRR